MAILRCATLALALTACAAAGGDEGGAANLPERGIAPWERVEPEGAPFVLAPPPSSPLRFGEPAPLVRDEAVHLYFHETGPEGARILRADSDDGVTFGEAREVLASAADPSPAIGPDGRVWLAFATPDRDALGLAASDDGLAFSEVATALIAEDGERLTAPSLVLVDGRFVLFYTTSTDGEPSAIARASGTHGEPFTREGRVLEAGEGCVDRDGAPVACWDPGGVTSPDVRVAITAAGRRVYRLFYRGVRGNTGDLGFAASWDGHTFSRYPFNPIVADRFDEHGPSQAKLGETFLLYWSEERSAATHGIALGVHHTTAPSERFE